MENRESEFLSEVKDLISDLRKRVEYLENKVAEYEQLLYSEETEPINLDIDELDDITETIVGERDGSTDLLEDLPEDIVEGRGPEPEVMEVPISEVKRPLWWTDMPGSQVKDIRSAISLNDRILFINTLFNEDPAVFQNAVNAINGMNSLKEVADYINAEFPQWNMDSETVYRFMMAVRRRVR
ncbi:MAG: hypothetical protein ACI4TU_06460 [Candidatus Cryptobacteroides sp.]